LKRAMLDVLRFWLDRDVDGIRMDAIHFLMKDPQMRDEPPNPGAGQGHKDFGEYDSLLHIHTFAHPDVHPILREIRALFDAYGTDRARVTIGETHIFDWEVWARYFGEALDELHLPFNFTLLRAHWEAGVVREAVDGLEGALAALPPGAWPNYVLGNHDEPRIASRLGQEGARLAMLLLLTLRGTPTLYYGDELGMEDVPVPPEKVQDPWGLRVAGLGLGRDPERSPMLWDDTANAGFCPPGAEPWLPIDPAYSTRNVQGQLVNPRSMLVLTRELLRLRRAHRALHAGSYAPLDPVPPDCFAYLRQHSDERLLVALNFAPEERVVRAPGLGSGEIVLSTRADRAGHIDLGMLRLRGHEGCLIQFHAEIAEDQVRNSDLTRG
jgi:alpha-glucosidase